MPYISQQSVFDVLSNSDIYDVVSGYFPLKRVGSNYKALCPFHDEKTPSFYVNPQRQIFKCFGCQKGGNVFTFVMEMEKVDFQEAVKLLAERSGIKIKFEKINGDKDYDRTILFEINKWAAGFFRKYLLSSKEAKIARDYLKQRGVDNQTSESFLLGFSPMSWDTLLGSGKKDGFDEKSLLLAGLAQKRTDGSGVYDLFRGRVMFPIFDLHNRIVGFGARALGDDQPKYLNTPQNPIFNKGSILYGLSLSKGYAEKEKKLYIVEGYFDVILPYQYGIKGIVATLGTALTREHIRVLKRFVDKVILVYDPDPAGGEASQRSLREIISEEIDASVVRLPGEMDPSDLVVEKGKDAFLSCIEEPVEIFDFLMESCSSKVDVSTTSGKMKAITSMLDILSVVANKVKQQLLIQRLSQYFSIDEKILQTNLKSDSSNNIAKPVALLDKNEKICAELIEIMLSNNDLIPKIREMIEPSLPVERMSKLIDKIFYLYDMQGKVDGAKLITMLDKKEDIALVIEILQKDSKTESSEIKLTGLIRKLKMEKLSQNLRTKIRTSKSLCDKDLVEIASIALERDKARRGE
jgi:DNA primase